MIHLTDTHILVPLPEGAKHIQVYPPDEIISNYFMTYYHNSKGEVKELPPGQWSILCSIDEVTEEMAMKVLMIGPNDMDYNWDHCGL